MSKLVNDDKLYAVIGKFFGSREHLLFELIQNSLRAKAKHISIDLPYTGDTPFTDLLSPESVLRLQDDGRGISDLVALLGLAFSDWEIDIASQEPAGLGFMQLISLSRQVYVQSKFGSIILDCQRFLNDAAYRQQCVFAPQASDAIDKGTIIHAELNGAAHQFIHMDENAYMGYYGTKLVLNEKLIPYNSISKQVKVAQQAGYPYLVDEYQGNKLYLELGDYRGCASYRGSLVNWYGQLIPININKGAAGNGYVRFYYEVRKGTPLNPRYPDRSQIIDDSKLDAFQAKVNYLAMKLITSYFMESYVPAKGYISKPVSLLKTFYAEATPVERQAMPLVPVDTLVFGNCSYQDEEIRTKAELKASACLYCVGGISVNDEYNLGADLDLLGCVSVTQEVGTALGEYGLQELREVTTEPRPCNMINTEPLVLHYELADLSTKTVILNEALLMNSYNEAYIYAPTREQILDVLDEYFETVMSEEEYRHPDDIELDIRTYIVEELQKRFGIMTLSQFDFLPDYHKLKQLVFETGNLALTYQDGSVKTYQIE